MDEDTTIGRPIPSQLGPGASDGSTLRLPAPQMPPEPGGARQPRRLSRRARMLILIPLIVVGLLIGLDRVAAVVAANIIADKIKGYGFPVKPGVTVEGFPFLTQVITRHFDGINITAPDFPAGPVTASVQVKATGIVLNSGYHSGTVSQVTGTGLISFTSIANAASVAGAPGLKLARAGVHRVRLTADLGILSASAIARVTRTGWNQFTIRIISSNGIPASLLSPIRRFTVPIPKLPQGLALQSVSVTDQGVLIRASGSNVSFGG